MVNGEFEYGNRESVPAEPVAIIAEPSSPVNRKTRKALRFSRFLYYAPASPVGLLFVNNSITEQLKTLITVN
jgi:hypothetical protein